MKYETPELTAVSSAISAIEVTNSKFINDIEELTGFMHKQLSISCYEDNE